MRFTKMHGAGNDYVYVDCFSERPPADIAATAIANNVFFSHSLRP